MARPTYILQVAFASNPDSPVGSMTWVDITAYLDVKAGVKITHGRSDEFSVIQPSTMSLTLKNTDGRFTPNRSSSPYYPNVLVGKRIRLGVTWSASTYWRFTGDIKEWPLKWEGGAGLYAETDVTSTDQFGRLSSLSEYRTLLKEDVLDDFPIAYYPMDEPAASVTAGDISGKSQMPLTLKQVGTGGVVNFGITSDQGINVAPAFYAGTTTAVQFAPASVGNGKYLTANLDHPYGGTSGSGTGATIVAYPAEANPAVTSGTVAAMLSADGSYLALEKDGSGLLQAVFVTYTGSPSGTAVRTISTAVLGTSAEQWAAVLINNAGTGELRLYRNGILIDTRFAVASVITPLPSWNQISVGGRAKTIAKFNISNAQFYDVPLPVNVLAAQWYSGMRGLDGTGDTTTSRLIKLAGFSSLGGLNVSGTNPQSLGPQEIEGNPLDAMQAVASSEDGVFFLNGSGAATLHLRNARFNAPTALTVDAGKLDPDALTFRGDDFGLINDVTGTKSDGGTVRVINQNSINAHGRRKSSFTSLLATDDQARALAAWKANTYGVYRNRITGVRVSLLNDSSLAPAVLALDVSSKITITSLPSQAPASTVGLFVEGWDEVIGEDEWSLSFNTSPAEVADVWQIGVAGRSEIGTTTRIGY